MKLSIKVYDQQEGTNRFIQARTVTGYTKGENGDPLCAWCRLNPVRKLCDYVQRGMSLDFVSTVAYCDSCHKATIIEWENEHAFMEVVKY